MNVKQALNLSFEELNSLNTKELAKVVNVLVSAANKRIRRIEAAGESNSLAVSNLAERMKQDHPRFSTKDLMGLPTGKRRRMLQATYTDLKQFMNNKTSTLSGVKQVEKELVKRFNRMTPDEKKQWESLSERTKKRFWKAYRKIAEAKRADVLNMGSDRVQELVAQTQLSGDKRRSAENIENEVLKQWEDFYTELKDEEQDGTDVSIFFRELEED